MYNKMMQDGLMRHEGGGAAESSFTAITTDGAPTATTTKSQQQQRQQRSWSWWYAVVVVVGSVVVMIISSIVWLSRQQLGRSNSMGCDLRSDSFMVDTSSYYDYSGGNNNMDDGDESSLSYYFYIYPYTLKTCWGDHGVKGPTILILDNVLVADSGRYDHESSSSSRETNIVHGDGGVFASFDNYKAGDFIYQYMYTMDNNVHNNEDEDVTTVVHITFDNGITYYDISQDTVFLIDVTTAQNDGDVQVQQINIDLSEAPSSIQSLSESNYDISSFIAQTMTNYYDAQQSAEQQQQGGGDNEEGGGRRRN